MLHDNDTERDAWLADVKRWYFAAPRRLAEQGEVIDLAVASRRSFPITSHGEAVDVDGRCAP